MPRNGSGGYAPPSNSFNPAVANTTIDPAAWNAVLSDVSSALSASLAKDGQTTATQRIPFAAGAGLNDGSAALPALAFTASATTGLYAPAADALAVAVAGAEALRVDAGGVAAAGRLGGRDLALGGAAMPTGAMFATAQPTAGTGTIGATAGSKSVTGTGTLFTREVNPSDTIVAGGETHVIDQVLSDTSLLTVAAWAGSPSGASYSLPGAPLWSMSRCGQLYYGSTTAISTINCALRIGPSMSLSGTSANRTISLARIEPAVTWAGCTGVQNLVGLNCVVTGAQTTAPAAENRLCAGVFHSSVGAANTQNWNTGGINSPAGLRGEFQVLAGASGTLADVAGGRFWVENDAAGTTISKAIGVQVHGVYNTGGGAVTNAVGTGIYHVSGANNTYLMLSPAPLDTVAGNWAIYDVTGYPSSLAGPLTIVPTTAGHLPSAAIAGIGARAFITDSTVSAFGSIVAGGGGNKVPVWSDGADWKVG